MRRVFSRIVLVALVLAGCALPGEAPETRTYTLALEEPPRSLNANGPVLEVSPPEARPGFASAGIAYREKPYELAYFAYSEWAAPPPEMLQPLLIEALEASGAFRSVLEGPQPLPADWRLLTELLALVHDFTTRPTRVEVAIRAQLIDLENERVIATRTFTATEPAPFADPYGGVIAANRALERLIPEIVAFSEQGSIRDGTAIGHGSGLR